MKTTRHAKKPDTRKRLTVAKSKKLKLPNMPASQLPPPTWRHGKAPETLIKSSPMTSHLTAKDRPNHYDKPVSPWELERHMESTGNAFVDARRTDAIEYAFRLKGDLQGDLKKAIHCLQAALEVAEEEGL